MIALFTTPVVAGVTGTGQCSGQTAHLADQFPLPHQLYDSFVYNTSSCWGYWYDVTLPMTMQLTSAVVKQPNRLISFHCLISFMIALFTTTVGTGVTGFGQCSG